MKKTLALTAALAMTMIVLQHCSNTRKTAKTPAPLSYKTDIAPILQASCTPCHFPPEGRKEALNSYEAVKKHIAEVITRVKLPQTDNKFMPFKLKKPALSDSAINVLAQWQQQNMPE